MGLSPKNTPRTPSYLLPFVTALATFSITALFLYKVYLSPSLFYISLLHFIKQLLYNTYIYIYYLLIDIFFGEFDRTGGQLRFPNQNRRGPQLRPNAVAPFPTQELRRRNPPNPSLQDHTLLLPCLSLRHQHRPRTTPFEFLTTQREMPRILPVDPPGSRALGSFRDLEGPFGGGPEIRGFPGRDRWGKAVRGLVLRVCAEPSHVYDMGFVAASQEVSRDGT
jgi:hypothetical protein